MKEPKNIEGKQHWLKAIPLTSLGWDLALPIFGGVISGYLIDQYFGKNYSFTLIMLLLGILIGYYNLYRIIELDLLRTKSAKLQAQKKDTTS